MNGNTVRRDGRDAARRPRRVRPLVTLVTGIAALGLLTAGCGSEDKTGTGVAAANPSKAKSGGPAAPSKGDPLAYSRCMREKGVPNFPDPDPQGNTAVDGKKVDIESAAFKAANEACKKFDPPPPPEPAANKEAAVKYAKCMRENGVPAFPDPNADGGTELNPSSGIEPTSESYKKADEICRKVLPGGGKKPPKTQTGG